MKPETILQSDVLDIVFDGRNKDYGAYLLRKNYNRRLLQSLGVVVLLAGSFVVLQSMTFKNEDENKRVIPDNTMVKLVELPNAEVDKPKPAVEKPLPKAPERPTIDNTTPVIDNNVTETEIPPVSALEGRESSDHTNELPSIPGGGQVIGDTDPVTSFAPVVEPALNGPLDFAEVMPSFNGDIVKFMLRHLRQPDDLEEGDRIVVKVKFVVDAEGGITDVAIMQSGRPDLDAEVIRVVKKMPRWNPGKQAGRSVPVYFNMPVTFVSNP